MNRFRKSIVVFLFFVGTAFLFSSPADSANKLAVPASWNNDRLKTIPTERERGTAGLPLSDSRRKTLPLGLWGGEHISVGVTKRGATVEYDCAHATVTRRITIDQNGRFNVSGMQFPERGGPVRQGSQSGGYSVRFAGQVNGETMTLSVSNSLTKELIGTFTLVHGAEPKLMKCK